MAKRAKLKDALDRQKGVDRKRKHEKSIEKKANKRKRGNADTAEDGDEDAQVDVGVAAAVEASPKKSKRQRKSEPAPALVDIEAEEDEDEESEAWETADEEFSKSGIDLSRLQDSDSDEDSDSEDYGATPIDLDAENEDDEDEDEEEEDDDIPLSDIESLASEDKADIIPHQRLTINNTTALTRAYKRTALPTTLPFSAAQVVVSEQPTEVKDIDDDLTRELAFYKQSLEAVTRARALLKAEGVPFSRPVDYFAEMVKSDEQMGKIKKKLVDDAASKKAAADARKQRDLKKFGKQVQIAKLQERDKAKRETLDRIKMLKKKRSGTAIDNANEDSMFDVALEDAAETARKDKADRRAKGPPGGKRQRKDEKFGFGGKKRFAKSNDAASSADMRGFSVKKMKGKGKSFRPGKARRAKMG